MFGNDCDEEGHDVPASDDFEYIEARNPDIRRPSKDSVWVEVGLEPNVLFVDCDSSLNQNKTIFKGTKVSVYFLFPTHRLGRPLIAFSHEATATASCVSIDGGRLFIFHLQVQTHFLNSFVFHQIFIFPNEVGFLKRVDFVCLFEKWKFQDFKVLFGKQVNFLGSFILVFLIFFQKLPKHPVACFDDLIFYLAYIFPICFFKLQYQSVEFLLKNFLTVMLIQQCFDFFNEPLITMFAVSEFRLEYFRVDDFSNSKKYVLKFTVLEDDGVDVLKTSWG